MSPKLLDRIRQCDTLPTLPAVAVQVLELVRSPNCQIPQLARLISKDPALASKILRTVNSSIYPQPKKISRLTRALSLLGLQTVRVLVLGFSLAHNLKSYNNKGFRPLDYWRRAIFSATAALTLAQRLHIELLEEAFIASLLMDVGMLVFDELLPAQYDDIHKRARTHADLLKLETELLGADHAEASGVLADIWNLPAVLSTPMAFHHNAAAVEDPAHRQLAEICHLAGRCADVFVEQSAAGAIVELREYFQSRMAMSDAECDGLLDQISRRTGEIAPLFDIHLNTDISFEEILKKANDSIIQINLESQRIGQTRATTLTQSPVSVDPGTNLADRGQFESHLTARLAQADVDKLAVLVIAIDEFQEIGQLHGAQAAATVLRHTAAALKIAPGLNDFAGRYTTDKLALAIPGAGRAVALTRAEAIRRHIHENPVDSGRLTLPATVTIGVAVAEPGSPFKDAASLLKAAESALQAAENAGRNCVRALSFQKTPIQSTAA